MEPAQPNQQPNPVAPELNPEGKSFFAKIPWYLWLLILVAIIATVLLVILSPAFKNRVEKLTAPQSNWTPYTETPPPILGGNQTYTIGGGTAGLPQINNLTLSPQDAKQGQTQVISITVNNATPTKEVIAILHLDNNKDFEYNLALSEGTNTNGVWKISIPFPGTYNSAYRVTVKAKNENNLVNMSTITIR
jgi:hypothetical protein